MRYVLDTDHVSQLQRGHPQVISHLIRVEAADRAVTIVTATEQLQGRLAVIRRATSEIAAVSSFRHLQETIDFYLTVRVLPYDAAAASIFAQLRAKKIRIGTQDLRIAAITLSSNATLVTRNNRDFRLVPQLSIVDWSMAG